MFNVCWYCFVLCVYCIDRSAERTENSWNSNVSEVGGCFMLFFFRVTRLQNSGIYSRPPTEQLLANHNGGGLHPEFEYSNQAI